ncbi:MULTISPECIES: ATP-dependent DNA helicase [unclassified Janthinobacterium]|uniref:ATP-dependent DNA helicase n=1 Tax=unclassified Janthinobacterium TaxID=2610881 RepID=UPI001620462A|nr:MULTISPECIES: ATP-dependent DNA helicase [unclassified Janthinobacterium]MBB5369021.1 Rad3-related DNA helicase [Janthinobacterium sp. K2C7]MBB5381442.1 Rad3-related DNA helicase [Janthinobacterium sp. K2Li3]MBB5387404.1 Rad3-related DNA helicase [Janthinobacterium sp. K2E3]
MKYTIAVRALCEFTAKIGDLDLRFTPSPTSQEGIAGHATVTGRRNDDYQREISLAGDFGPLHVRGRADGYDPARRQLEEIKTYRGELDKMPANHRQLHWAQARIYGHLLCQQLQLPMLRVALVYFDIASQKETVMHEECTAEALRTYFEQHCSLFLEWAEQELAHRQARDTQLKAMSFPHATFRPGQRQLAEAMYKASTRSCCLLAQAPTGIGKSVGSLFPMLKATAAHGLDKVFFLAAKVPGRQMALDACAIVKNSAPLLPLRVLELSAKASACAHPDKACHGESCPLARGFYDRLPLARAAALASGLILDKEAVRAIALQLDVCPYYLGMELARWSDVVIGDYNYYFDHSAMLYGMTVANDWKVNVLIDEAHNMVARTRGMYTAELEQAELKMLRKIAPEALKKPLDRVSRQWTALLKEQDSDYLVHPALPEKFFAALQNVATAFGDYMTEHAAALDEELQRFYFDVLLLNRLAESFGDHSLFDVSKTASGSTVCIRNIVPAPFLKSRFEASRSTALFSATLSPWNYYSDTLGMPESTAWVDVESPFQAEQLAVRVADTISTRYQHRAASLLPIAELMARQYAETPGNYLAFFSSFDYMEKTATLFAQHFPDVPIWLQPRRMDDGARTQFLGRFGLETRGIGFAVLGGAFGEGIDLPGARLIGAFIATLGLPQINPVNEQIRQRMGDIFGAGYDYTYLYPGMQKVVQAAGRVIRTQSDKGVVYLIDDRFARPEIRQLLPIWWDVQLAER